MISHNFWRGEGATEINTHTTTLDENVSHEAISPTENRSVYRVRVSGGPSSVMALVLT